MDITHARDPEKTNASDVSNDLTTCSNTTESKLFPNEEKNLEKVMDSEIQKQIPVTESQDNSGDNDDAEGIF